MQNHPPNRPDRPAYADFERRRRLVRLRRRSLELTHAADRRRSRRIVVGLIAGLVTLPIVGAALAVLALGNAAASVDAAHPRVFPADSLLFDRRGSLIADLHPSGATRIPVPLTEISPLVQQAIVAVEDRSFWTEGAVDIPRLAAAAISNLTHGTNQGASTIPMQLAKILYLSDSKTLAYKLQQIALAQKISSATTRPDILDQYLNDIYYGSGATGIEAAARTYFGIDASRLDLAQAAMLAGIPNSPTTDDPHVNAAAAVARQHQVLDAMVDTGAITLIQEAAAEREHLVYTTTNPANLDPVPFFTARVVASVKNLWHLDALTAGLRITSTIDMSLQQFTQNAVTAKISQLGGLHVTDGAAVVIQPSTGEVLAYVGSAGANAPGGQIDMAAVPRQPGSSFKIFTYTTAIATGTVSMVTPVLDGPLTLPTGAGPNGTLPYSPFDYDRKWHGILPVERALGNSLNIPAIRVEMATGIPAIVATARAMGVTTLNSSPSSYSPSMTLGTYPIPPWEMAQAGTVLADAGVLHPARFIIAATFDGKALPGAVPAAKQVVDPRAAYIMNAILSNDANRVMEFGAHGLLTLPGHLVSAKTGTSENFKDNYTVGWTPQLATATWVGNADDSAMQGTTGITGAAPIWHQVMAHALTGIKDSWPAMPSGLTTQTTQYGIAYFMPNTDATTGETLLVPADQGPPVDGLPAVTAAKKHHHKHPPH